jgi:hypothetical protein
MPVINIVINPTAAAAVKQDLEDLAARTIDEGAEEGPGPIELELVIKNGQSSEWQPFDPKDDLETDLDFAKRCAKFGVKLMRLAERNQKEFERKQAALVAVADQPVTVDDGDLT